MRRFNRPGVYLGIIAVVFAMSGSAYATSKITGAQIKDGTITGRDIKNDSIRIADVSQGLFNDLKGGPGPAGPAGPAGAPGAPGLAGVVAVDSPHFSLAPGQSSPAFRADCPAGKVVIGTGVVNSIAHLGMVKSYTYFVGGFIYNDTGTLATDLSFQAICASASGGAVASSARSHTSEYRADRAHAAARLR